MRLPLFLALSLCLAGPLSLTAQSEPPQPTPPAPNPLLDRFDPEVGLWWDSPAKKQHNTIHTAYQLAKLAQVGRLRDVPVDRVLSALRAAQVVDGSGMHGNFMQFPQQKAVTDANAAFFVGLNLCALRLGYADQFSPTELALLDQMGKDMVPWFDSQIAGRMFHYPNKFMGDLACAWLLTRWLDTAPSETLIRTTQDAKVYWMEGGWGWAEHMSDLYTRIMLDQIGCVLALVPDLPKEIRSDFEQMRDSLLAIEAAFVGGPRVPSLRSYAFHSKNNPTPYWQRVKRWELPADATGFEDKYGMLFHQKGLTFSPPKPLGEVTDDVRYVRVPCINGETATAWLAPKARIGSVSRFPLGDGWEHRTWGLAWQSFPIAFADDGSGWGFLRWRATENSVERAHPTLNRGDSIKALIAGEPTIVGQTFSRQNGARILAIRRLSATPTTLTELADALELLGFSPEGLKIEATPDGGQSARFSSGGKAWTFGFHPLDSGGKPEWGTGKDGLRWDVRWNAEALKSAPRAAHLWWLVAGEAPNPSITRVSDESPSGKWKVEWPVTEGEPWALQIDPMAEKDVFP